MEERSLLLAKIEALVEQLKWAESSFANAKVEPWIANAASVGFAVLFDQKRKDLARLRKSVPKAGPYAGYWKTLRRCSDSCRELFQECLEFLGGAMLRDLHKGNDICEIADALLQELSNRSGVTWKGVTLLAEAHFFTESTGLIRLPFPDYGIWNLPIAAHELGHFIGPRISDRIADFPFQARLNATARKCEDGQITEEEMMQETSHLRELFSDLFAIYALGPAYACACIVLRFDPQDDTACQDGEQHPSHAKRVHFILKALEQISKTSVGDPYRNIVSNLEKLWQRNLKSAEQEDCLDQESIPPLNYLLLELYPIIDRFVSTVRYSGWSRAVKLSGKFLTNGDAKKVLAQEYEIADVINAAWLWRLRQTVENRNVVHQVNLEAIELCRSTLR